MFLRKPVNTSVLGYWTSFLKNGQNGPLISRAVECDKMHTLYNLRF